MGPEELEELQVGAETELAEATIQPPAEVPTGTVSDATETESVESTPDPLIVRNIIQRTLKISRAAATYVVERIPTDELKCIVDKPETDAILRHAMNSLKGTGYEVEIKETGGPTE